MAATALIVAGGVGRRMAGKVRKQYRLLNDTPVVGHPLRTFDRTDLVQTVVLVVPPADVNFVEKRLLPSLALSRRVQVVSGGGERQESVYNGLCHVSDQDQLVVIHDGVRPFVPMENLRRCLQAAREKGAAILAVPMVDTLKKTSLDQQVTATLPREGLWQVQTPQVFQIELIREAHRMARAAGYRGTDDADLVQKMGQPVWIVPGRRDNIKITTRDDLILAEALCGCCERI